MQNYEIVRKLASQGACGTVLLAKDKKNNNTTVVIKRLPASDERSATERRVMRNLRHSGVVRYLDSWISMEDAPKPDSSTTTTTNNKNNENNNNNNNNSNTKLPKQLTLSIAMEYCAGGDLRTAIRSRRQTEGPTTGFPEDTIRRWLVQICSALYYCHMQHIIHRDLKSENVLLDATGTQCKLADFGFARELAETAQFATTRLGTPHSLPPEVYDGTPYNKSADMWCVGIILYELMTLQRPFLANTMEKLFECILRTEPRDPEEICRKGTYKKDLFELQKRLLSKNPKNRPSAREILEMPWASGLLREVRLSPLSEEQKSRERSVWDRISFNAQHERGTVVMELCPPNPETRVNVRSAPKLTENNIIGQLATGDMVEVMREIPDEPAAVTWYQTTTGFCIRNMPPAAAATTTSSSSQQTTTTATTPPQRNMFRRIAEWRVRRPVPGSSSSPPNNKNSQATTNQQQSPNRQQIASPTFTAGSGDSVDLKTNEEAAQRALETQIKADSFGSKYADAHKFLVVSLLQNGMPEVLLKDLLARYKELSAPMDDMPWTMYCVDALRPLKLIPWVPVLRFAALTIHAVVGNNNNNNNNSSFSATAAANSSAPLSISSSSSSSDNSSLPTTAVPSPSPSPVCSKQ